MKVLFLTVTLFALFVFSYSCGSSGDPEATSPINETNNNQEEEVTDSGSSEPTPPGEFVRVADMKNFRIQHSAILLDDGKV
ncbi:MAG: hypothetical protein CL883_01180, partial [Dehalococcoidia bacterium]|nr:hypothetical protein [Dehalococcoidia bacterium]